jgi:hypothetical protein
VFLAALASVTHGREKYRNLRGLAEPDDFWDAFKQIGPGSCLCVAIAPGGLIRGISNCQGKDGAMQLLASARTIVYGNAGTSH